MKVERVSKKDENNVVVYLDNGEKLFLSYEVFLKNGLRQDKEISESHFSLLVNENKRYFVKKKALSLLARRMHSINELRLKLWQKKYDHELVEDVLSELIERDFLNDYTFANLFADEKIKNSLWGIAKLKAELFKKGIDREVIERIILEKFPDGNEIDNAMVIAEKKLKSLNNRKLDVRQKKQKLLSFLSSKGFDYETGRTVTDNLISDD